MDLLKKIARNIKNKFIILIPCFLLIINYSCSSKNLSEKIGDYINNMNIQNDSIHYLNLSQVTPFKWDTLYVFGRDASLKDIENILQLEYPDVKGAATSWVFIREHKIVYYETIFVISDDEDNIQVFFDIPDSTTYTMYTDSIFKIKRESLGQDYYGKYIRYIYHLSQ